MVCRNEQRGETALSEIKEKTKNENVCLLITDLSSQREIRKLGDEIKSR